VSEHEWGAAGARRGRAQIARAVVAVLLAGFPYLVDAHTFKDPNSSSGQGGAACPSGQIRKYRMVYPTAGASWIGTAEVVAASEEQCNYNIANGGYGHCRYSASFSNASGTEAWTTQYKANGYHVIDPYVYTHQVYHSQCQAAPRILSLQAGGQLAAGETLQGQQVRITAAGSPVANLPVWISALRRDPAQPEALLNPSAGEGAACSSSGATLDCTTDSDGIINFDFAASGEELVHDALHDVTVICSDSAKPCSPNQAGPSLVTVTGCPITLALNGGGNVPARKVLEGQGISVRNCRGEALADVEVEVTAVPVDPVLAPAGALRLEGSSDRRQRRQSSGRRHFRRWRAVGGAACGPQLRDCG
jgi:hypothetical protein